MLSSLGFDSKGSRNSRNSSKYVLEVPRGFSVHVFKSPSPPPPQQGAGAKPDYASRTPSTAPWKPNAYPSRQDADRKPSLGWSEGTRREPMPEYDQGLALTRTKSNKPYGIVPGAIPDTYIYERSISSVSDLPGSPLSSSSSDTDSVDDVSPFSVEVSSTRASSSTETLEATAYYTHNRDALNASATSPYGSPHGPVIPPSGRQAMANITNSHNSRYVPADRNDDEGPVILDDYGALRPTPTNVQSVPTPLKRVSDERSGRTAVPVKAPEPPIARRDSRSQSISPTANAPEGEATLRLPPGLQYPNPSTSQPNGPMGTLQRANSSPTVTLTQRSPPEAVKPPLTRGLSNPETEGAISNAKRCVRWTEDLVCPSPVPAGQRRKGWFNRRGDQLWTNDGKYKCAESGQEYPPDLAAYPEPQAGWMNEEGVRIDVYHRLIPKPPLRSALKQPKNASQALPNNASHI